MFYLAFTHIVLYPLAFSLISMSDVEKSYALLGIQKDKWYMRWKLEGNNSDKMNNASWKLIGIEGRRRVPKKKKKCKQQKDYVLKVWEGKPEGKRKQKWILKEKKITFQQMLAGSEITIAEEFHWYL